MTEVSQQAAEFLENVFDMTGLQLRVKVKQAVSGEVLDIEGHDAELLQASHELLSRMTSIRSFAEILSEHADLDEPRRRVV